MVTFKYILLHFITIPLRTQILKQHLNSQDLIKKEKKSGDREQYAKISTMILLMTEVN